MSMLENVTTLEDEELLMSKAGYFSAAVVLFFIGFFGFFLNLFVILLMWKEKQLWTPLNIILFNLVCSDFSVSILGNPWTLLSAISYKWIFGNTMCVIYGFFMSLLGITSITSLTVLAFERYVIVSQPLKNNSLSNKDALFAVFGIWVYSFILTSPPLFGWGKYVNEAANISCSVNWQERSTNAMTYILYLFAFGLVIPLIVIVFSYTHIIYTMKKNKLNMGRVSKAEGKIAYMILIMIISFLIAWTPYSIVALLEQFAEESYVSPSAGVLPALIAKSSICYNPIIYVGLNSQFRESLKQFLTKSRKNREETYTSRYISKSAANDDNKRIKYGPVHMKIFSDKTSKLLLQRTTAEEKSNVSTELALNEV